jgi:sugar lactone lactonase YvrE
MSPFRSIALVAGLTLPLLCACANLNESPLVAASNAQRFGPEHAATGQTLYVVSGFGIAAYDTATLKVVRTYVNSDGLTIATFAVTDAAGDLFVGNQEPDDVLEFAAGSKKLVQTIPQNEPPVAMAFDGNGNLYVAYSDLQVSGINVYSPKGRLLRTIAEGVDGPAQLAFDSKNNLYVANYGGPVSVYDGGATKLTGTLGTYGNTDSLAIDASDDIYVGTCLFHCKPTAVVEFGPEGKSVIRTITRGIREPGSLALDASGNLFVNDGDRSGRTKKCFITAYAQGATSPFETITDGVHRPGGVLFDAAGNLYVANGGGACHGNPSGDVTVYPPGRTTYSHKLKKDIHRVYSITIGP